FVAEFLGAERGLKRLALTTVGEIVTADGRAAAATADARTTTAGWPDVEATMTPRAAPSLLPAARAAGAIVPAGHRRLRDVSLHDLIAPPAAGGDREGVRA